MNAMSEEVYYQVSFVVVGGHHPGAIMSLDRRPEIGEIVGFGAQKFEVLEVQELAPIIGNFGFLHVTCRPVENPL